MARLPRLVLPGYPYHVTQRGNRRQQVFFESADYALYRDLLAEAPQRVGAEIRANCLMPNHVHVIVVPSDEDGLRRTFAEAHRRYTGLSTRGIDGRVICGRGASQLPVTVTPVTSCGDTCNNPFTVQRAKLA